MKPHQGSRGTNHRGSVTYAIRRARPEDASALPSIERSAGTLFTTIRDLEWIASGDDLPVNRYLELISEGISWVASTEGEHVVAFLCAQVVDDGLHVWELAVALQHQRVGIGHALMLEAIDFARKRRLSTVSLTTFRALPWNEPAYRKMGFTTLRPDEYDQFLSEILRNEEAAGLPGELRCAMRLFLHEMSAA